MTALIHVDGRLVPVNEYEGRQLPQVTGSAFAAPIGVQSESTVSTVAVGSSDFTPIGIGKPLSVELLTLYTGDSPGRLFGKPDLLVAAGIKAVQTFDGAARSVAQLVSSIKKRSYYGPSALRQGAPVLYYSPAVVDGTTLVSVEFVADRFPGDAFDQFGDMLGRAAGLPVFAPAGAYLWAGGALVKIASGLSEALVDGDPFFSADLEIRFDTPGWRHSEARFVVLTDRQGGERLRNHTPALLDVGSAQERFSLVDGDGNEYSGDASFALLVLDGRVRPELESYAPALASASLLERFYGKTTPSGAVADALLQGMKLYNDVEFRRRAEKIKAKLAEAVEGSEEYKALKEQYDAAVKNIGEAGLKPPE